MREPIYFLVLYQIPHNNVVGGFFFAKHAARVMIPANKGVIIFTASMATESYIDLPHTYKASKNALWTQLREKAKKWFGDGGNLEGVLLHEQDVENGVLYLASDDSKYVSGLNFIIHGGFRTTNVALTEAYKKLFLSSK
nr:secoisolariciresinol dehydrogenase-like [Solanum lycopersicum]